MVCGKEFFNEKFEESARPHVQINIMQKGGGGQKGDLPVSI